MADALIKIEEVLYGGCLYGFRQAARATGDGV